MLSAALLCAAASAGWCGWLWLAVAGGVLSGRLPLLANKETLDSYSKYSRRMGSNLSQSCLVPNNDFVDSELIYILHEVRYNNTSK